MGDGSKCVWGSGGNHIVMYGNQYIYINVGGGVDRECIGERHRDCMAVSGNVWGWVTRNIG